jgi:hypothetical protein
LGCPFVELSFLRSLNIAFTTVALTSEILQKITEYTPNISTLSVDVNSLPPPSSYQLFTIAFSNLTELFLTSLKYSHDILPFLFFISETLPNLTTIHIERESVESDFIVTDMYANASPSSSEVTDEFMQKFNYKFGGKVELIVTQAPMA